MRLLSYISHRTVQHTNSSNILTPSLIILNTDQTDGKGKLLLRSSLVEQGNPPSFMVNKGIISSDQVNLFLGAGGSIPCTGEAPPQNGSFFQSSDVGILLVEVYERVGKSVISVCKMT